MSHSVVRSICADIRNSKMFSIILDGTQDASGDEQESICFRYVDSELTTKEEFIGEFPSYYFTE